MQIALCDDNWAQLWILDDKAREYKEERKMNRIPSNSFFYRNLLLLSALGKQNKPKPSIAAVSARIGTLSQTSGKPDQKKLSPGIHPGPYPKTEIYVDKSGASIIHCAGGFDSMVKKGHKNVCISGGFAQAGVACTFQ